MPATKDRLRWPDLPHEVRHRIEHLAGAEVLAATNCAGGYSPGLASRLRLADGGEVFAKAVDGKRWPLQRDWYQAEAAVTTALPVGVPAPTLLGTAQVGDYVVLVFQCIDGREPIYPQDLQTVLDALTAHPAPPDLPADHPRLGGWSDAARPPRWSHQLLLQLETLGLEAVRGEELVHFDLYPHNVLVTSEQVYFVDWPHARRGQAFVDVLTVLVSAATQGVDPEPYLARHHLTAELEPVVVDGVLAAYAGFCVKGAGPGPIGEYKAAMGAAALRWLAGRLGGLSRPLR